MNGAHVELFTFCLFHNQLYNMATRGGLDPLKLRSYISMTGTDFEPGIRLVWSHFVNLVCFDLERLGDGYIVFVSRDSLVQLPEVIRILCDVAGFKERGNILVKAIGSNDVQTSLRELAYALSTISSQGPTHA